MMSMCWYNVFFLIETPTGATDCSLQMRLLLLTTSVMSYYLYNDDEHIISVCLNQKQCICVTFLSQNYCFQKNMLCCRSM